MALSTELSEALARKDFAAVENEWLLAVEQSPGAIDDFLRAADTLDRLGQGDKTRELLEVLDDQLKERGLWDQRLDLLHGAGRRFIRQGTMFDTVMTTIRSLYEDRTEQLEILLPAVGLDGERDETPKLWDKVQRLRNLLIFETGTVVAMKGKGVGEVTEVNLALQALKVDFEKQKGVSVGFRAAGKMLDVLPEGHVLREKHENPESLEALDPSSLLQRVLQSYEEPLTGAEVKEVVAGIVTPRRWTSWWTSARKHPQVLTMGKGKQTYAWADTGEDAAEAIWEAFEQANLEGRLDQLRRASNQEAELLQRMVALLAEQARPMLEPDSPLLPTGLLIWGSVEKHLEGDELDPTPALATSQDLSNVLAKVDAPRVRDRVYELVREHRDDWLDLYEQRFPAETDARSLRLLLEAADRESREARDQLLDRVLAQPAKAPAAFTWIAEEAMSDDSIREYRPVRLLKQILIAIGDESFSDQRAKLSPLADSGGTVPKILSALDEEQSRDAKAAIERARGLEQYQREPLVTSIHLRFPHLEEAVESPLFALRSSYEAKREELRKLLEEEIPENRRAIEVAREMGDLRENFEYKSARQRHEYLSSRASDLSGELDRAVVLQLNAVNPAQIRVGTTAVLRSQGSEQVISVLGPWESDPANGVISHESEMAERLIGRKAGDVVEIDGTPWTIASVDRYQP